MPAGPVARTPIDINCPCRGDPTCLSGPQGTYGNILIFAIATQQTIGELQQLCQCPWPKHACLLLTGLLHAWTIKKVTSL